MSVANPKSEGGRPVRLCERMGCPNPLTGGARQRFCSAACRAVAWKQRTHYVKPTGENAENAPVRPRKPSGLQVSYRRALAELSDQLSPEYPEGYGIPASILDAALRRALSDRQRQRLEAA